jgi:BolA protein
MRAALTAAFSPSELEIVDQSELHKGHAGHSPDGETHYAVKIRAPQLAALGRVQRHRAVNDALKPEFDRGLHALSIDAG